jgi:hypothetical protein
MLNVVYIPTSPLSSSTPVDSKKERDLLDKIYSMLDQYDSIKIDDKRAIFIQKALTILM